VREREVVRVKLDVARLGRVEGVIRALLDVLPCVESRATLADDDLSRENVLVYKGGESGAMITYHQRVGPYR
jgi:hypothetical protein